jgi:uncharacterized protein YukE
MPKSVSYTINAKDKTKQALNSAKGGLNDFKGSLGAMKGVLGAAFSVIAIKKAADTIGQLTDTYGVQQGAELKLAAAAKNNPVINGEAVKRLKAHAAALQGTSIYGDEQMIEMEAWLTAQGRTEEQIKSIMSASVDLASSGIMPLDAAMKNLSKTYAGSAGRLAESVPALKELTKEQLASGEAVKMVAEQYKGMGAAVAGGVAGTKQQLANLKGDIQESLGEIFTGITGDANKKLLPVFNKINEWLQGNKNKIINVFRNIPQVAQATFALIKNVLSQVLSVEFFVKYGGILWRAFLEIGKTSIGVMFEFLKAIGSVFWEPLKYGFQFIIADFKVLFANLINFFVDKINYFFGLYNKLADSKAGKFLGAESAELLERRDTGAIAYPENKIKENIAASFGNAFDKLKESGGEIADTIKESFVESAELGGELFSDEFDVFTSDLQEIVNTPLQVETPDPVGIVAAAGGTGASTAGSAAAPGADGGLLKALSGLAGGAGGVTSMLVDMGGQIAGVNALMNWQSTILSGFLDVIAAPLNEILSPIVGILIILGKTLGAFILPLSQNLWAHAKNGCRSFSFFL